MTEMRDPNARPAYEMPAEGFIGNYDTVFLCYPIWGGQAPKIIQTFLENTDLSGKTVIPFATSNSSGFGSSDTALRKLTVEDTVWLQGKGVKKGAAAEDIISWVNELNLNP